MSIDTCPVPSRFLSGGMLRDKSRYVPLCPGDLICSLLSASSLATDRPIFRLFLLCPPDVSKPHKFRDLKLITG